MTNILSKIGAGTRILTIIVAWVLVAVWGITEKEPPGGNLYYGNIVTVGDQAVADLFGVPEPGVYVANKNHKPVTAVRGGLGMILRGLATGDGGEISVGWRGLKAGLVKTTPGIILLALFALSIVGLVLPSIFRRRKPASDAAQPQATDGLEIGILFDIDELGGGFYGYQAYKTLFNNLDPEKLVGCTLHDGDTKETLARQANQYCVAFEAPNAEMIDYVKQTISHCGDKGLVPVDRRFLGGHVTGTQPLVLAGVIDSSGTLVVKQGSMIGAGWAEGTKWKISKR